MEMPLTLGKLIAKLEQRPHDNYLLFDFGGFAPTSVQSHQGNYKQERLAVGFAKTLDVKVSDFLPALKAAIEKARIGDKRKKRRVHLDAPVWVSNDGYGDNAVIADVQDIGRVTVLLTAFYDAQSPALHTHLKERRKH